MMIEFSLKIQSTLPVKEKVNQVMKIEGNKFLTD